MYRNNINSEPNNENTASASPGGPTRKCRTNHRRELITNHENFVKLRTTIDNTTGLQSDPAGAEQVINSSKKRFAKETFKLLNKNLNSNSNKFQ